MRRKSFEDMPCSIAQYLEVLGDWWSMLVIRDAFLGVRRFDAFRERLGISRNVLAQRLDHLVTNGILERVPYQEHPVRHEYRLTEKGRALMPVLTAMRQWGDTWAAPDGPPVVMHHEPCGHVATGVMVCSHCGEPLDAAEVFAEPGPGARDADLIPEAARERARRARAARAAAEDGGAA